MTGPEHYAEAERLLALAPSMLESPWREQVTITAAQVHATLALAAATAQPDAEYSYTEKNWYDVVVSS
jgi:hypothetical protein